MVATSSTMLSLGTEVPDFSLTGVVDGNPVSPRQFRGSKALVVMFICNHCPYVRHVLPELARLAADYEPRGVAFLAINSNDSGQFPEDAPPHMRTLALAEGWRFPFLFDQTQEVAKAFRAACTPDFYAFDAEQRLAYRGQLDDSRPGSDAPVTGRDLRAALDAILAGKTVAVDQRPSLGCNIKWTPGNEPGYFGAK